MHSPGHVPAHPILQRIDAMPNSRSIIRLLLAALLCHAAFCEAADTPSTANRDIVFGMSAPFSGSIGSYGVQMREGVRVCFAKANDAGGINGRRLRLTSLDDGYEAKAAAANARTLIEQDKVFALIAFYGTAPTTAVLPVLDADDVPLIGTISGASVLRSDPHVFHLRASYGSETEAIVRNLTTIGMTRIAVVYQDDGFGQAGLDGVKAALRKMSLSPVGVAAIPRNTTDIDAAVATISPLAPQAIVMVTLYRPTAAFVERMAALNVHPYYVALSPVGTDQLIQQLGKDLSRGIQVAQVVPYPWGDRLAIVREYKHSMAQYAPGTPLSYYGLEGYMTAKLAVSALQRVGPRLTRKLLVQALHDGPFDLGGYKVDFSSGSNSGSNYVEMSVIGRDGQILN